MWDGDVTASEYTAGRGLWRQVTFSKLICCLTLDCVTVPAAVCVYACAGGLRQAGCGPERLGGGDELQRVGGGGRQARVWTAKGWVCGPRAATSHVLSSALLTSHTCTCIPAVHKHHTLTSSSSPSSPPAASLSLLLSLLPSLLISPLSSSSPRPPPPPPQVRH